VLFFVPNSFFTMNETWANGGGCCNRNRRYNNTSGKENVSGHQRVLFSLSPTEGRPKEPNEAETLVDY
jgi:hypothetical protein